MNEFIEIPANKKSLRQRRLVFGVGINDANYMVRIKIEDKYVICPYYQKWTAMLERCHSEKYQKKMPTYKGCSVCDEWLLFSNFKSWMAKQDWEGKELDKDLLFHGNKVYSPKTCFFVPRSVNLLLGSCASRRGEYPLGVSFNSKRGCYESSVSVNGKPEFVGRFPTPELAHEAYKVAKYKVIHATAMKCKEPLRGALLNHKII